MHDQRTLIDIGREFSRLPAGRTPKDGEFSGEGFRVRFLKKRLADGESLILDFGNVLSAGSSFLEEAFGGLIRERYLKPDEFETRIHIVNADPFEVAEIIQHVRDAEQRL